MVKKKLNIAKKLVDTIKGIEQFDESLLHINREALIFSQNCFY